MAWSNSKVMLSAITDMLNNTCAMDGNSDTWKAALFDNTITPSQTDTSAHNAYGGSGGAWASGNVTDTGSSAPAGWPTVGISLGSITSVFASNVYTFDAADITSANGVTTLASTYGTLIYDSTLASPVANQALCYLYFGGAQAVTLGTFTIVLNASGILTITG